MSVVDTSTWKPFRVGDLFTLERPKARIVRDYEPGDMPFVASGMSDNGVSCLVASLSSDDFDKGQCLTVSPLDGSCFWQSSDFLGRGGSGASVCILRSECLTERNALFVASCVRIALSSAAGYGNLYTGSKLLGAIIMLPATPDGEPDWAYMETYMQHVFDREEMFAKHLASLTAEAVADGHVIDTSVWKAFHLYDVFDIDMGNKFDRSKMPIGDTVNFVGRTGLNNGVNAVCGYVDGVSPYASGLITLALGGTIGACFVQTEPFYTSQNVVVLIPPEHVGLYGRLFASGSIYASATSRYKAFSDELNRHVKSDFTFMLPATSDGAPDWAYMEQYMKDVMAVETLFADELDRVYCE